MKHLLLTTVIFMTNSIYSQWVTKKVDNQLDDPYRIAYCMSQNKKGLLKLEQGEDFLALYITGSYYCDDYPIVDIALTTSAGTKRYQFEGRKSNDSKTVFFVNNILSSLQKDFLSDFKIASTMILRVDEEICEDEYYKFNMDYSAIAIKFMSVGLK